MSDDGYFIVAAGRSQDEHEAVRADFESRGRTIHCHAFDITNNAAVESLLAEVQSRFERLDSVVNSAGISYVALLALANIERYGRIVHIGSISGTIGASYNAIYAASKAGIAGLVKSLALEVAPLGITVNAVQPGTVHTELFEQTHGARASIKGISLEEQKRVIEADNPQRQLVRPDEIAAAVTFLVSDGASAVNGHLLNVDGGRSIA